MIDRHDRLLPPIATIELTCRICQGRAGVIPDYRDLPPAALLYYDIRYGAVGPVTVMAIADGRVCDRCLETDVHELAGRVRIWYGSCLTACGRVRVWRSDPRPYPEACDCGGALIPQSFADLAIEDSVTINGPLNGAAR